MPSESDYVRDAVEAARESFKRFCFDGSVLEEARSVRLLAAIELDAIQRDAEAFARGELPVAAVVFPARQFSSILDPWPEEN